MRIVKPFLFLLLLSVFILQSCSIEKRLYTNGYSFQWKKNEATTKPALSEVVAQVKKQPKKAITQSAKEDPSFFTNQYEPLMASAENKKGIILFALDSTGCDTLVMRNETEIKARVIEITSTEIKYKYCDNVNGPTYVSYRYEVSYIKYANGRLESFKDEYAPSRQVQNQNNQNQNQYQSQGQNQYQYQNNQQNYNLYYGSDKWVEGRVKKLSVISAVFGFISLVPYFGIPGIFIAMNSGFKALRLIKKNERELGIHKQKAWMGIGLAILAIILYIAFFVYLLAKAGVLHFII